MPDERARTLINLAADGVATPEELEELERLTRDSRETEQELEQMRELVRQLDQVELPPVPSIKSDVMSRVTFVRRRSSTRRRIYFGAAWAAAAAIAIFVLIPGGDHGDRFDETQARGQMTASTGASWRQVAAVSSGSLGMTIRRNGDWVDVTIENPGNAVGALRFDTSRLDLVATEPSATISDGEVIWTAAEKATVRMRKKQAATGSAAFALRAQNGELNTTVELD